MFLSSGIWKQNVQHGHSSGKYLKHDAAGHWTPLHLTEFNTNQGCVASCRTDTSVIYTEFNAC